ncbi:MAG: hypothetical protein J5654_02300 [Victivallales bacterium]|nr:hypothetical protein [Victivallales bacterium]
MACFIVPLAETVIASGVKAVLKRRETKTSAGEVVESAWVKRLGWLQKLGFGGSALLAIEHIYHGEITFVPPFLTAMNSPETTQEMLHEMATAGTSMALLITVVWAAMCAVDHVLAKKHSAAPEEK